MCHNDDGGREEVFDVDRMKLAIQGLTALGTLACATLLGIRGVLDSEAIAVLFGAALGAVGAGQISSRRETSANGTGVTAKAVHVEPDDAD